MKMAGYIVALGAAAAMAAAATGCEKVWTRCTVHVEAKVENVSGGDLEAATGAGIHIFYADTSQWLVRSYDEALAGTVRERSTGAARPAEHSARADESGAIEAGPVTQGPVLVVVYDTQTSIYAWRMLSVSENLEAIHLGMVFRPWKGNGQSVDGKWTVVKEAPVTVGRR